MDVDGAVVDIDDVIDAAEPILDELTLATSRLPTVLLPLPVSVSVAQPETDPLLQLLLLLLVLLVLLLLLVLLTSMSSITDEEFESSHIVVLSNARCCCCCSSIGAGTSD